MELLSVDWSELFVPGGSLVEVVIRGTVIYLFLFVVLRLLPRRQAGTVSVSDLLLVVLIADAAQNGLAGEYRSITEGILLVATLIGWDYLIDWLDFRFPQLRLNPAGPILLVRNGRMLKSNMERQKVSEDELMSQLRQHGVDQLSTVRSAQVEPDGHISVIPGAPPPPPKRS
jgi:uncharacterized membrane protein YcaP (DUF421 family)